MTANLRPAYGWALTVAATFPVTNFPATPAPTGPRTPNNAPKGPFGLLECDSTAAPVGTHQAQHLSDPRTDLSPHIPRSLSAIWGRTPPVGESAPHPAHRHRDPLPPGACLASRHAAAASRCKPSSQSRHRPAGRRPTMHRRWAGIAPTTVHPSCCPRRFFSYLCPTTHLRPIRCLYPLRRTDLTRTTHHHPHRHHNHRVSSS